MRIVDPHHHLWDLERNRYPWLGEEHDRGWGDWSALKRSYRVADLLADAEDGGIELLKSVHVQANYDPSDPVGETRWLEEVADDPASRGLPTGIVGYVDLSAPDAEAVLERHAAFPRLRGIRQVLNRHPEPRLNRAPRDFLAEPQWRQGLALLRRFGLSFDLQIYHHQAADAAGMMRANPDTAFILDHALMPADRSPEGLEGWRQSIALLSRVPNLSVKLSGFGMVDLRWTEDTIRPFVRWCIGCFGPDRCMFASNFPVDRLMSDYGRLWRAYDAVTADLSDDERAALFRSTAERVYRL